MRKGTYLILSSALLLMSINHQAFAAEKDRAIQVILNGESLNFEVQPVNDQGVTLVPFRLLMEKLGMTISWDSTHQVIEASNTNKKIHLQVGANQSKVNDQTFVLEKPPVIVDGSTLVPLRFVSESIGAEVKWDEPTNTIHIAASIKQTTVAETEAQPQVSEPLVEKPKKEKYSVDFISDLNGITNVSGYKYSNNTATFKYLSMQIDAKSSLYILEDRNVDKQMVPVNNSIHLLKVNLTTGSLEREKLAQDSYEIKYTNSAGQPGNTVASLYFPKSIAYNPATDKLFVLGFSTDKKETDTFLSIHERLPSQELIGYQKLYSQSIIMNSTLKAVDQDTFLYTELATGGLYQLKRGNEPKRIASISVDHNLKTGQSKIDYLLKDNYLYLFNSTNCTLTRINRDTDETKEIFKKDQLDADTITTHNGKFYISKNDSIYELDTEGNWILLIDGKKLIYPPSDPELKDTIYSKKNISFILGMTFDQEGNIIVIDDGTKIRRINI